MHPRVWLGKVTFSAQLRQQPVVPLPRFCASGAPGSGVERSVGRHLIVVVQYENGVMRLIEAFERARWPTRAPSLPDLLTYLMEQHGLSRADLVPLLGTPSRVSEVLTGKRGLSMSMVRKLRERFHISADLLISPVRRRGLAA